MLWHLFVISANPVHLVFFWSNLLQQPFTRLQENNHSQLVMANVHKRNDWVDIEKNFSCLPLSSSSSSSPLSSAANKIIWIVSWRFNCSLSMQQHSQIIELKDRLVQALDVQLNVCIINNKPFILNIFQKMNH